MVVFFFFFKLRAAYEMRISDWSSDVCSSDLLAEIAAWDIAFPDPDSAPSRALSVHAVRTASDGADAGRGPELVISAVTAAQDLPAAHAVTAGLAPNGSAYCRARGCPDGWTSVGGGSLKKQTTKKQPTN